ncbi:MAG: DUF4384 domain-containing protein [Bryobacteraceae bacterium]
MTVLNQNRVAWILCLAPVAVAAGANTVQSRQISDMFYTDTLAKPVTAKTPPKKQNVTAKKTAEPAASVTPSRRKVGLKYRVQLDPGVDTDPARTFRSGEGIRLVVESNIEGYLYVVLRGSSGGETQLFPDPRINDGKNLVKAGTPYTVPANGWFRFDAKPGEEKLLLVVSRSPMEPAAPQPSEVAQAVSYNTLMAQLSRTVQSRDLVFTKDENPPAAAGATPSHAVIWVNASDKENQAVHATVVLQHR